MNITPRLFISHSWNYNDAFEKLCGLLANQNFNYYDHSVPQNDPIHTNGTDKQLYDAIEAKIKGVSCVLILAGVYATHSKWINKEIEMAQKYCKPVIAIQPWGAEKTSTVVKNAANRIVGWNGTSVVNAIKELTR